MSYALERTLPATQDLDWLPTHLKAVRWTVAGAIWTALGGTLIAFAAITKGHIFFVWGKGIGAVALGGYYAGDRAARAILRGRLSRIARGAADLRMLSREADGEVLHVRGRVRAKETISALLDEQRCVYRRVTLALSGQRAVHEAAVDFSLVDDSGELVTVQVEGARLLVKDPKLVPAPYEALPALQSLELPPRFAQTLAKSVQRRDQGKRHEWVRAGEVLLQDGDVVELVGYKTRVADQSVQVLERETPMRAVLRSGRELPLLISPIEESLRQLAAAAQKREDALPPATEQKALPPH